MGLPESPSPRTPGEPRGLEPIFALAERIEVSSPQRQAIRANWKNIVRDLCVLSMNDIALKYGIGERTLWYVFKELNLTIRDIKTACEEEEELRKLKLMRKQSLLKVIPKTVWEATQDAVIKQIIDDLKAIGVTDKVVQAYIKTWVDAMNTLNKHISDFTIDDLREFIIRKRTEWEARGKDLRDPAILSQFSSQVITPLRVLAKAIGLPIPPFLRTSEYESPYRHVRVSVKERFELLRYLKERYPQDYEILRAILILLYETGSRASALKNFEVVSREYAGQTIYLIRTKEKGKRKSIIWEKPLKPTWARYVIPYAKEIRGYKIQRLKRILREAYEAVLDKNSVTYKYAMLKPLHVWRHTATNDLLEESNYNILLVAKRLGWKNPAMVVKVYGDMSEEILLALSGYNISVQRAKHEFLYGEWLEIGRREGLL